MDNLRFYLLLFGNALICTAGTVLMRFGGKQIDFSQGILHILTAGKYWLLGMVLCWSAGLVFALTLTKMEVIYATSFYAPILQAMIILASYFFLHESVSATKLAGILFALIGLVLMVKPD